MPIPQSQMIFCSNCGKLIKIEVYGDVLTPEELLKKMLPKDRCLCRLCKMKKTFSGKR